MRKVIVSFTALMFAMTLVGRVLAADSKEMKGVLIDKMCADKMAKKDDPQKAAEGHKVACAKKCADSGFGLMMDGKWKAFDDAGNKMAKEYIEKDDAKTAVTVKGTEKDDGTIAVESIAAQS